jgi:hypothetical protein
LAGQGVVPQVEGSLEIRKRAPQLIRELAKVLAYFPQGCSGRLLRLVYFCRLLRKNIEGLRHGGQGVLQGLFPDFELEVRLYHIKMGGKGKKETDQEKPVDLLDAGPVIIENNV